MGLKDALRKAKKPKPSRTEPLWKGPIVDGITFSMLSKWLICRERFRINVIEGLRSVDDFNPRLEYGNCWHICEESLAAGLPWRDKLTQYCQQLAAKYQTQAGQVNHWYEVCKVQFPLYVNYWRAHPDVKDRTPLLQEQVFDVPYTLPSGRIVRLRGKFDSVDIIGKGEQAGIYIQENKSKGDIDPVQMRRQLVFDFQTLIYRVAFDIYRTGSNAPRVLLRSNLATKGVRYNVIRRPLSGGKGSIKQKQGSKNIAPETSEQFYERLGGIIEVDCDEAVQQQIDSNFFMRWKVDITPSDVENFQRTCLYPILEQLCDWYEWVTTGDPWRAGNRIHFRTPYGIYSPLLDGGATEVDNYLDTGSTLGLTQVDSLFGELQ